MMFLGKAALLVEHKPRPLPRGVPVIASKARGVETVDCGDVVSLREKIEGALFKQTVAKCESEETVAAL